MRASIQRFQIICELGSGGMGIVYRARDPRLERDVAIKVLTGTPKAAAAVTTRDTVDLRSGPPRGDDLLAEARMMARLSHPNVVPIYEVGRDDDTMFLVMEYIAGANLRTWLREPRTTEAILEIYAQAARGMLAAHTRGIIHRDFKPDNVLIGEDGRARVADFGLANVVTSRALLRVNDNRGTLRYMAPELFRGQSASVSSDVYALCVAIVEAFGADQEPGSGLRARGVPDGIVSLVVAGLDDRYEARPELAELVHAFDAAGTPSDTSANQYAIVRKLATGGMAEIFLARAENAVGVERHVVLKRVLPVFAGDARFVQMFVDEARVAAQLQHPNVAQVYDSGKLDGSYFFTMEYVHGVTVSALVRRARELGRAIPIPVTLAIVAGAAAGLHHAHECIGPDGTPLRVVHRDVSPSNLMVSYEGHVKVVDFGIAKARRRGEHTDAGTIKGKPLYMSPEQCSGGEIDRRSDLFSLGIVMWELLVQERLFQRESDLAVMQAIASMPVAAPSSLRGDVSAELDQIVLRLLAKQPHERFQTARELQDAIEATAAHIGTPPSVGAAGRFVRELFGDRPLPWMTAATAVEPPVEAASPRSVETVDAIPTRLRPPTASPSPQPVVASAPRTKRRGLLVAAIIGGAAAFAGSMIAVGLSGGGVAAGPVDARPAAVAVPAVHDTTPVPDAAVESEVIADAALAVASEPVDAMVPDAGEPIAPARPAPETAAANSRRRPSPAGIAAPGRRYEDTVAACTATPALAARDPACPIAACHVGDVAAARRWLAALAAAKRHVVRTECARVGVDLHPQPGGDQTEACRRDPMSCQY